MNRYVLIRRLRVPAVLLLVGIIALLDQMGVVDHFWKLFFPLVFILIGLLLLAERAILAIDGPYIPPYPAAPYPNAPYAAAPYPNAAYPGSPYAGAPVAQPAAPESTSIVPAHSHDFENDPNGGHS